MTLFAALAQRLLNKVIHSPVESIGNSKIIFGLPPILMFHFNFRALCRIPLSEPFAVLRGRLVGQ
jgi:hypothetical protein